MSGGSFNYTCYLIDDIYSGRMEDVELDDLLTDFIQVLHDLEWWKSDDYSEEQYRETVTKFKNRWLKQYNKDKCYNYCRYKLLAKLIKKNLRTIEQEDEGNEKNIIN